MTNWDTNYSADLSCNNWNISITSESTWTIVCDSGFGESGWLCVDISSFSKIVVWRYHNCWILPNTEVKCWGQNNHWQLGFTANNSSNHVPTTVSWLTWVTDISIWEYHTCALLNTSEVKCWGRNNDWQVWLPTTTVSTHIPTTVSWLTWVASLDLWSYHSCALMNNSTIKCWGQDTSWQLGKWSWFTTWDDDHTPSQVADINNATKVSLWGYYSCALLSDETVKCWGFNYYWQLGKSEYTRSWTPSPTPETVWSLTWVRDISAWWSHACALLDNSSIKCWGHNYYGQLGNSTNIWSTTANPLPLEITF